MTAEHPYPDVFFPEQDCALLLSLVKSPDAQFHYDDVYDFLVWDDESPQYLQRRIQQIANWQILLHYRMKLWYYPQLGLEKTFDPFETALWKWSLTHIQGWIGFSRTSLSPREIDDAKHMIAKRSSEIL